MPSSGDDEDQKSSTKPSEGVREPSTPPSSTISGTRLSSSPPTSGDTSINLDFPSLKGSFNSVSQMLGKRETALITGADDEDKGDPKRICPGGFWKHKRGLRPLGKRKLALIVGENVEDDGDPKRHKTVRLSRRSAYAYVDHALVDWPKQSSKNLSGTSSSPPSYPFTFALSANGLEKGSPENAKTLSSTAESPNSPNIEAIERGSKQPETSIVFTHSSSTPAHVSQSHLFEPEVNKKAQQLITSTTGEVTILDIGATSSDGNETNSNHRSSSVPGDAGMPAYSEQPKPRIPQQDVESFTKESTAPSTAFSNHNQDKTTGSDAKAGSSVRSALSEHEPSIPAHEHQQATSPAQPSVEGKNTDHVQVSEVESTPVKSFPPALTGPSDLGTSSTRLLDAKHALSSINTNEVINLASSGGPQAIPSNSQDEKEMRLEQALHEITRLQREMKERENQARIEHDHNMREADLGLEAMKQQADQNHTIQMQALRESCKREFELQFETLKTQLAERESLLIRREEELHKEQETAKEQVQKHLDEKEAHFIDREQRVRREEAAVQQRALELQSLQDKLRQEGARQTAMQNDILQLQAVLESTRQRSTGQAEHYSNTDEPMEAISEPSSAQNCSLGERASHPKSVDASPMSKHE